MRPRWDCMLRAVDCAVVDKNNALLLGAAVGESCGANTDETDQYR